ncbi:molybdopterin-dependent oxidoreductase [Chloroflexota bacterium]
MGTEATELPQEKVVRTVCHGCHSLCGVLVNVKGGRVVKIEGDPQHPHSAGMICPKGFAYMQLIYHPERLRYPLKRFGERGEGKWQRISWNEVLDTIADKLTDIKERYGPLAIAASSGGNTKRAIQALYGLMRSLGCPNVSWTDAHYCWGPFPIAEMFTYGGLLATEARIDARNSNCLVMWGANPVYTYPILGRDILKAKARGAKLIVVDPRLTPLASKADIWLQVRPGTDAALALGMLNIIINSGLFDKEFMDKWCSGFAELRERVQEYPPKRVAEITWLATDDIIRAARMYAATKPAALFSSVANELQLNSVQTIRAIASLIAITGNIDVKGGNTFESFPRGFLPAFFFLRKTYRPPDELEEKRLGAKEFPLLCGPKSPFGLYHPPHSYQSPAY